MSLISGINKTNNKQNTLNIDDNGNLKLDESGALSNIETNTDTANTNLLNVVNSIDNLYNYNYKNDLRYLRSQGKCYILSGKADITASSDAFSILNPSGSSKKIFLYGLSGEISNVDSANYSCTFRMELITAHSGSTSMNGGNLNFSSNNTTVVTNYIKPTSTTTVKTILEKSINFSSNNETEYLSFDNLFNECMEIPQGYGLNFRITENTASPYIRSAIYIRYLEIDSSENFPTLN